MMLYTTLKDIKAQNPCKHGWSKLLKSLGKTKADDVPLEFKTILDSNGLDDTLWCLRALKANDREVRLYAVWCARQVEHLDTTGISRNTNNVSEQFATGNATSRELKAAREAGEAAWEAAREAAGAAAREAAWAAAWEARAAGAAAREARAAGAAAREAAGAAAREAQKQEFIKRFCTEGVS